MRRAASESAAAPVSHNAAGPVELNDVCRTKLKLSYQTDSDAALILPNLIHQLDSAHEWSGVWIRPKRSLLKGHYQEIFIKREKPIENISVIICKQ